MSRQNSATESQKRIKTAEVLATRIEDYRKILAHIAQFGGYASDAAKELGLKVRLHEFRLFAKEQGFVLKEYALAWKRYGFWLTLPGPYISEGKARYIVPAVCLLCGVRYQLNLINAKSSKSICCHSCARQNAVMSSVLNEATGETYRSIRSFTLAIERPKQYQTLRIQLRTKGSVCIDGITYSLVDLKDVTTSDPNLIQLHDDDQGTSD